MLVPRVRLDVTLSVPPPIHAGPTMIFQTPLRTSHKANIEYRISIVFDMAMGTTAALLELISTQADIPLSEDTLRAVRSVLIKKSHAQVASTENETTPDIATDIFTPLLHTALTPTIPQPHRALASDTLSTYLIRTRTTPLPLPRSPWAPLTSIITTYFDDAQSALSKALKDLLSNLLSTHPDPPTLAQTLTTQLLTSIHDGNAKKVTYLILETLLRKRLITGTAVLAEYQPGDLVSDLLGGMRDRTLSPVIGKALVAILSSRRNEIGSGGGDAEWVKEWNEQLKRALRIEDLRANVQVYALPGLFKLSSTAFKLFVDDLGLERHSGMPEENVVVMTAEDDDVDGAELMSLLCCLKVGKDLGFVSEEKEGVSKKPTITVSASFTTPLLFHPHAHIRLAALTLLIYSPAPTHPLSPAALAALKLALPSLHTESDAEVRNLIMQSIRTLLERLAASSYALSKSHSNLSQHPKNPSSQLATLEAQIRQIREFLTWYISLLRTQLHPTSSYQRTTSTLKTLGILLRSGLDRTLTVPDDPKKVLNWPASFADIEVLGEDMKAALRTALFNPFDDVRSMASSLLSLVPSGAVHGLLEKGVARMNVTGRERDADGVARVILLLWEAGGGAGTIDQVLGMLEEYLAVARRDFGEAVRGRPVHGLLAGLRMVFSERRAWEGVERGVVERVLGVCSEVWEVARGVLCVDSPEGSGVEEDEEGEEVGGGQGVMSYSWRAVKEASSLLSTLLSSAPPALLSTTDFTTAGALLISQLSTIRHRGAFSAVSPSFTLLCTTAYTSPSPSLSSLPAQWLTSNLHLITTSSSRITRRSAGLPFLLVGVLASETDPSRPLLKSTFSHLSAIASQPPSEDGSGELDLPQVHALNVMKHLFTDSRMSAAITPYIGTALSLAVSCFGSPIWALRNCGIMLFTALLNRLFGMRKAGGEYGHAFDTRGFFERYPGAKDVLLGNLRENVKGLDTPQQAGAAGGVEMVYPALSLISRLEYSPDYNSQMAEFTACVEEALQCRIWKVREIAARAYTSLVGGANWKDVAASLLNGAGSGLGGTNGVHGRLCAVRVLFERKGSRSGDLTVVWAAMAAVWDRLLGHPCAVIRAVTLQIVTEQVQTGALGTSDALYSKLTPSSLLTALTSLTGTPPIGHTLLKTSLTSLLVTLTYRHPTPPYITTLTTLLTSPDEETSLLTANHLLSIPRLPLTPHEAQSLSTILWTLTAHHWPQLRTAALRLRSLYGTAASRDQHTSTLLLATDPPTEPLQHAALVLLGHLTAQLESPEWQYLPRLLLLINAAAGEEHPFDSRWAALQSLSALSTLLDLNDLPHGIGPERLLGAWLALYDLLNDDDDELRDEAAVAVCKLLPGTGSYTPLRAGELLMEALMRTFNLHSGPLVQAARDRLLAGGDVTDQLQKIRDEGTDLFAKERQNLYIDDVIEAHRWGGVLRSLGGEEAKEEVVSWVAAGLEGLRGVEVGEEEWAVAVRVVEGVRVVRGWGGEGWDRVQRAAEGVVLVGLREALDGVDSPL